MRATSFTVISVSVKAPLLPVHETTTSGTSGEVPVPDPKMMFVSGGEGAKTETVSEAASPDSSPGPTPETNSVNSSRSIAVDSFQIRPGIADRSAYPNDAEVDCRRFRSGTRAKDRNEGGAQRCDCRTLHVNPLLDACCAAPDNNTSRAVVNFLLRKINRQSTTGEKSIGHNGKNRRPPISKPAVAAIAQLSRKLRSLRLRLGCLSLRKALASIWRMRSLVTENC